MKAFHGDITIKEQYLARVRAHAAADEIIKGQYWESGRGCAVGCTIHSWDHVRYELELGISKIVARLEDKIFEGLPLGLAKTWPERFLKSIKPGADLSLVWAKFASRLLTDPIGGVIQYAKTEQQLEAIQRVSDLYEGQVAGLEVPDSQFREARNAAVAAAAYTAAYAATYVAAVSDDNVYTAYASTDAADVAAASDDVYVYTAASRDRAYIWQSELLLELLRSEE